MWTAAKFVSLLTSQKKRSGFNVYGSFISMDRFRISTEEKHKSLIWFTCLWVKYVFDPQVKHDSTPLYINSLDFLAAAWWLEVLAPSTDFL